MDDPTHPDPLALAAYLDGTLRRTERVSVDSHLAECPACRRELLEAGRIQRAARAPARRLWPLIPVAAAAGLVLVLASRDEGSGAGSGAGHREPAVQSSEFPLALMPRGNVAAPHAFHWSRLPGADRYELTLFDAEGRVLWNTTVADTVTPLPDGIALEPLQPYFWRVRARVGWSRWVESELAGFRPMNVTPPR